MAAALLGRAIVEGDSKLPESAFITKIFQSQIAKRGGPVRRKVTTVVKLASLAELKRACRKRGFMIMHNNNQYVMFGKSKFKIVMS